MGGRGAYRLTAAGRALRLGTHPRPLPCREGSRWRYASWQMSSTFMSV
jgi:hypothetical protein